MLARQRLRAMPESALIWRSVAPAATSRAARARYGRSHAQEQSPIHDLVDGSQPGRPVMCRWT